METKSSLLGSRGEAQSANTGSTHANRGMSVGACAQPVVARVRYRGPHRARERVG
jgi:hypothetical protein